MAAAANQVAHSLLAMYEDLNEIATLRFNKELESISSQTREKVRAMQSEYAALINSSGVRSGHQETAIGRAQIEGSERLVRTLFEIWVNLVKRRNGHISRSDVDFVAKKLEGFAQTQKGHLHSAFSSQRMGAVVNLLTEEAGTRLYAATANARRDLAIMAREHELFPPSANAVERKAKSGNPLSEDGQQRHSTEPPSTVGQQRSHDSERHNISTAFDPPNKKTILAQMWSWGAVGALVLFALAGGITFMTSGHPWAADGFYVTGTALFLIKFWTWEDTRQQPAARKWLLQVGLTMALLIVATLAITWNHAINPTAPTGHSGQSAGVGTKVAGIGTAHSDDNDAGHKRKLEEQARPPVAVPNPSQKASPTTGRNTPMANPGPQVLLQQFTLVLRNDVATPQFYVNDHERLPISYSLGIATFQLPTGSYLVRAEYPNWTCSAFVTLPLEKPRPVPVNCKLK